MNAINKQYFYQTNSQRGKESKEASGSVGRQIELEERQGKWDVEDREERKDISHKEPRANVFV